MNGLVEHDFLLYGKVLAHLPVGSDMVEGSKSSGMIVADEILRHGISPREVRAARWVCLHRIVERG